MTKTYHHEKHVREELAKKVNSSDIENPLLFLGIPPKWFRQILKRNKRRKAKMMLKEGRDPLPEKKDADCRWW